MNNTKTKRALRLRIFERDEWLCWFCGIKTEPPVDAGNPISATVDHFLPGSKGGSNEESNLVTACKRCNSRKRNRTIEEYRAYLRYSLNDLGRAILLLQAGMALIPESHHHLIQETIDQLEVELPPITFYGEYVSQLSQAE